MNIKKSKDKINHFYVLPLRDLVIFPKMITHILINRANSIKILKNLGSNKTIMIITQKDSSIEQPKTIDLYRVGMIVKILQIIKLQNSFLKVLVVVFGVVIATCLLDPVSDRNCDSNMLFISTVTLTPHMNT